MRCSCNNCVRNSPACLPDTRLLKRMEWCDRASDSLFRLVLFTYVPNVKVLHESYGVLHTPFFTRIYALVEYGIGVLVLRSSGTIS
jgi:hypothetical protein